MFLSEPWASEIDLLCYFKYVILTSDVNFYVFIY